MQVVKGGIGFGSGRCFLSCGRGRKRSVSRVNFESGRGSSVSSCTVASTRPLIDRFEISSVSQSCPEWRLDACSPLLPGHEGVEIFVLLIRKNPFFYKSNLTIHLSRNSAARLSSLLKSRSTLIPYDSKSLLYP